MSGFISSADAGAGQDAAGGGTPGPTHRSLPPLRTTSRAASLQAFFHIACAWKLTVAEQMILLGLAARSTFFQWKKCGEGSLPRDTSERIFYLVGIHQALLALLPDGTSLPDWLRQPSETQVAPGSSLLRRMLLGRVADLYLVHRRLVGVLKQMPNGTPAYELEPFLGSYLDFWDQSRTA
jgi:hypothetical protein